MFDTIVIGAGQAGLAVGYYLKQSQQKFLLIDRGSEIGESWKERYDSLILFTPRQYNLLPGLPLSGDEQGFPTKDEIASYLKKYVETFELPVQLNEEVMLVTKQGDPFIIHTNLGQYVAKNIIIATGPFHIPHIPVIAKELSNNVNQLHSSQYKNNSQLVDGNVLVVGGGNSGAQIATELSSERETYIAVSKKLNYFPLLLCKRSIFWWFDKLGILNASSDSFLGKLIQRKGDPVFGFDLKKKVKNKRVKVKEKVIEVEGNQVTFVDGTTLEVRNIIWATGFKIEYPWLYINGVLGPEGKVLHRNGVSNIEGLYFIGLPWQSKRGSALLQGVGDDAKYIVGKINSVH